MPLVWAKNGSEHKYAKTNFLQPMPNQGAHAIFWEIGVVGFLLISMCSHEILTMLPSSFQCVFNMFLKFFFFNVFPWNSHHSPSSFQCVSTCSSSFFCVPMKFSPCSHEVFNVFSTCSSSYLCVPQSVPNSSSLYPKSIALSYTLAIYITSSKDGLQHIHFENVKRFIYFFVMGQSKHWFFSGENLPFCY